MESVMTRIVIFIQNLSSHLFIFASFFSLKIVTYSANVDYDQRGLGEAISTKHTGDDMGNTNLFQGNGTLPIATLGTQCSRTQWMAPQLRAFGAVRDLTAGGSSNKVSEAFNGCSAQQFLFRC